MTHTCEYPITQDTAPISPRPEQGALTNDNDLTKTDETLHVIDSMVDGLNDRDIDNMGRFAESFRWMGNAGCGFKDNLQEFQEKLGNALSKPRFQTRFASMRARLTQGEWCAAFGRQEACIQVHLWESSQPVRK